MRSGQFGFGSAFLRTVVVACGLCPLILGGTARAQEASPAQIEVVPVFGSEGADGSEVKQSAWLSEVMTSLHLSRFSDAKARQSILVLVSRDMPDTVITGAQPSSWLAEVAPYTALRAPSESTFIFVGRDKEPTVIDESVLEASPWLSELVELGLKKEGSWLKSLRETVKGE